jgi:hypothetical protein
MCTRQILAVGWLLAAGAAVSAPAGAQSIESDVPEQASHLEKDTEHYAVLDVGTKYLESANYEDEKDRFSIKIGVALLTGNTQTFLVRLQWIY